MKLKATPRTAIVSQNESPRLRRQARERLATSVLEELWSFWRADPRVPSVRSRRSWAISRNASPRLVDGWFLRRKACAKKAGQPVSDGSYDLPLDTPIVPKREQSATPVEPEPEGTFDLPSDDTLVLVYPPDEHDLNDIETSSDTIFEDASVEPKGTDTAYKEVLRQPSLEHNRCYQPWLSSTEPDTAEYCCDKDGSSNCSPFPTCTKDSGSPSSSTCILCSTTPAQGIPDEVLSHSDATSVLRRNSYILYPHLDFLPDMFSELSAIPFLFRTPHPVLPDSHRTEDGWATMEDELGRLVNDGKLDFSFLDDPHLASLELLD